MRPARIRVNTASWMPPTIVSAASAGPRQLGMSSWMLSSMISANSRDRFVPARYGARPGGQDLHDAHPGEPRIAGQEPQKRPNARAQPRLHGRLGEIGAPDMPGHLVHPGIVGSKECILFAPEVLIESAPRHPCPYDDRLHAHLRIAELGCGIGDRGQNAFTLVGGDEAAQQPVPAAGQLIRPADRTVGTPGLATAPFCWLPHGHLAIWRPPSVLSRSPVVLIVYDLFIAIAVLGARSAAAPCHPQHSVPGAPPIPGRDPSTRPPATPWRLVEHRGTNFSGSPSSGVDSANSRVLLSGNLDTTTFFIARRRHPERR